MKKILLVALAIIVVSGLILSGCAKPTPAPPPTPPPAPAPAPAPPAPPPPPEPEPGGILKVRYNKAPVNIGYPVEIVGACHHYVANVALERLLKPGEGGTIEPRLATSWELAPDKLSYTFHLRKGVKFHDGTPFNAEAVKYNLDLLLDSPLPYLMGVESIDVIDEYTVRLNLSEWTNLILQDLANDRTCLMASPTALREHDKEWAKTHPVGTGPFKIKSFDRAVGVKYERFDDYWGGAPYLDGVEMLTIVDPMTALAAFKAGEIQAMIDVDPVDASQLEAEGYDINWYPGLHHILTFDSKDPDSIWADKRVRQALEYALKKEAICKALGYGYLNPVYEIVHSGPWHPDKVIREYNPDKARQLLAEAGYPDGFKTKLIAPVFAIREFPVAIQGCLAEVGIDLELEFLERGAFMNYRLKGGLGNKLLSEPRPPGASPLYGVSTHLPSYSHFYPEVARTPGLDDLIAQALVEPDPDKLAELLAQMDKLAYDDAMFIPLWNEPRIAAFDPSLQDHEWYIWGTPDFNIRKAWLKK